MSFDREPSDRTAEAAGGIGEALTHRYRRFVIYELCQSNPLSLSALTDRVHAWDRVEEPELKRRTVRSALRREHLPVLERVGLVDYDEPTGTVRLNPTGERAEEIRRLAIDRARE